MKRFDIVDLGDHFDGYEVEPSPDGDWVDYDEARASVEAARLDGYREGYEAFRAEMVEALESRRLLLWSKVAGTAERGPKGGAA